MVSAILSGIICQIQTGNYVWDEILLETVFVVHINDWFLAGLHKQNEYYNLVGKQINYFYRI